MIGIIDVGGGTRGIFGAGVFDFCMDNDINFAYVIGVSAGSANGSGYLSHQPRRNLKFYDEYAFRKEYMSLGQFIKTGNYINLDYVYSTLSNSDGEDPFDYETMKRNPAVFEIVATDALSGKAEYFSKDHMRKDYYDCIKASCCVPAICKPYKVNGIPYYDGGMSDPIPYQRAFDMGCDRLVIILTRPKDMFRKPEKDKKIAAMIRRKYPNAAKVIADRGNLYNAQMKEILSLEKDGRVLIVAPDEIGQMKTLTKNHKTLRAMYQKGYHAAKNIPAFLENS